MAKSKKYDFRVMQDGNSWAVEITRRITSKETVVSKSRKGFSSESEAQQWGKEEIGVFLQSLIERNKRRAGKRRG